METSTARRRNKRKVLAIAAGFAAIGIGATATLAAWTDSEWVFGGNGAGAAGVGTSTFSVQQNTDAAGGFPAAGFVDEGANPGGEIVFAPDALDLTPGDSIYAAVALRTSAASDAGTVELQAAVVATGVAPAPGSAADTDGLLFDALEVAVVTDDAVYTCDEDAFDGLPGSPTLIADGALGTAGGATAQALAGAAGSVQYYCFEITLPDPLVPAAGSTIDDYMGLSVAPAWEFAAISS